jgi:hypothetical protein
MTLPKASLKRVLFRSIGIAILLLGLYLISATLGLIWTPYTCMSSTIQTITNLSGYDFKVIETDCSTIGEDASVSVYISLAGRKKEVLLFKYGPAGINPYPSIAVSDPGNVSISIPVVSDLILQRHKWLNVSIDYRIGQVMHPTLSGKVPE